MASNTLQLLSQIASAQFGCFTRAQANEHGVSNKRLRGLTTNGSVERVSRRVFRFTGATRSWHQATMIACLDAGPEALASHRTAAALHCLDGFDQSGIVEVLVPMHVRHRRAEVIVHHTRDLPDIDRAQVGPIPVTSISRTLIDLGAVVPATRVEEALDAAERDSRVGRAALTRRYTALRAPGRNGIGAMTLILDGREATRRIPRSVLERRMRRILERAGLPQPVARFITTVNARTFELDFAYPDLKLGIELDSHGAHATRKQRAADNQRENLLADIGWSLRRFTYEEVMYDERLIVSSLRRALSSKAPNRL